MPKNVIVTVRYHRFAKDIELPTQLCVGELSEKLLEALKGADNCTFHSFEKLLLLHDGFCLADEAATLEDYGIRTGDFLDVEREA